MIRKTRTKDLVIMPKKKSNKIIKSYGIMFYF